jgi:hypothetical protein
MTEDIFFRGQEHKRRCIEALVQLEKVERDGKADPWYAAGLYILTAYTDMWTDVQGYVSQSGIKFDEILEKCVYASSEITLIEVAANLFRDSGQVDLSRFTNLDERNFDLVMQAIKIRRYSLQVRDLHVEKGA